jgi:hypothetical protein
MPAQAVLVGARKLLKAPKAAPLKSKFVLLIGNGAQPRKPKRTG